MYPCKRKVDAVVSNEKRIIIENMIKMANYVRDLYMRIMSTMADKFQEQAKNLEAEKQNKDSPGEGDAATEANEEEDNDKDKVQDSAASSSKRQQNDAPDEGSKTAKLFKAAPIVNEVADADIPADAEKPEEEGTS